MKNRCFADLVGDFITEDARALLRTLGHTSMDAMSRADLRTFQKRYLAQKSENERNRSRFLVDRSYADVAAYWLVRDSFDLSVTVQNSFEQRCQKLASKYDLHVYFPFGQIPFESDGYRSEDLDFHQQIDLKILELLDRWGVAYMVVQSSDLEARVQQVLSETLKYSSKEGV